MKRSPLCSVLAASAVAFAAMTLIAPSANATQTETQIKNNCAGTGDYFSYVSTTDGHRYSSCCYKDYKGKLYCDLFKDGTMYGDGVPAAIGPSDPAPPKPGSAPPPLAPNNGIG